MRTFIQLDVQNLFFSAKDINKRIDFLKIKNHFFSTGEEIAGLNAYIIRSPDAKSGSFENFLTSIGYDLVIKKAVIGSNSNGDRIYTGTDQDINICIDCMRNIDKFDKWVLMSGDGDFIDLCRYLKKKGKVVEVWALSGSSFNKKFCDYVDSIYFLNQNFFFDKNEKQENKKEGLGVQ